MQRTDTDLISLINVIPEHIRREILKRDDLNDLLEIVLDLGRRPEARFLDNSSLIEINEVSQSDIDSVVEKLGEFGEDNRSGIERTLHRISAIRNRRGRVVGITFRVGRAVYGTIRIIEDLILSGNSVLLLGRPGVGKTTMLREVARVLADTAAKRVIVVDTSNEIAGDGDIPHKAIGGSRRMQVPSPTKQHDVMIEAVENHMPEVIIIDEIGTELEANAARTIAERGVQLVATAHGNTLENLIMNPTLSDLIGGIQTVTLGDIEARRRRGQKTVLERNAPPTFDILVEIKDWNTVNVHTNVANTVDKMLRKHPVASEIRSLTTKGTVTKEPHWNSNDKAPTRYTTAPKSEEPISPTTTDKETSQFENKPIKILPYGVNRGRIFQVITELDKTVTLVNEMRESDLVVTTKNYHRRGTEYLKRAEQMGKPVFVLRKNTTSQIEQFIRAVTKDHIDRQSTEFNKSSALLEVEEAISMVEQGKMEIPLRPQNSIVRRLQHKAANKRGLESTSMGRDPLRHVVIHGR